MKKYRNISKVTLVTCMVVVILLFSLFATETIFKPKVASATYNLLNTVDLPQTSTPASENIYILFEGVEGEVMEKDHKAWCEVISIEQAHIVTDDGYLKRPGNVAFEDIVIVKVLDKASPKLAESVCTGRVFPKVEIDLTTSYTDAGRVTYYSYQLGNVRINSYSFHGSGSAGNQEDVPTEELTISFDQIKATYTEFDDMGKSKGKVEYTWKIGEPGIEF